MSDCPFRATTAETCIKVRRSEFLRHRFEWEPFPCEGCRQGSEYERADAEKRKPEPEIARKKKKREQGKIPCNICGKPRAPLKDRPYRKDTGACVKCVRRNNVMHGTKWAGKGRAA